MAEWFESLFDGLYRRISTCGFVPKATLQQADVVRRLLRVRRGDKVLDIPCGTGRLTLPMARKGLKMTGQDLQPSYIRLARARARRAGLDARFVSGDMREIQFAGEFDAAFNWFGSFGYFSNAENLEFCRRVLAALRPGGRFLVEGPNRTWIFRNWQAKGVQEVRGVRVVNRNRYDKRTDRVIARWTFSRRGKVEQHASRIWVFSGPQIKRMLERAGFEQVRLYGRVGRDEYGRLTRQSRRILAVGCRPKAPIERRRKP